MTPKFLWKQPSTNPILSNNDVHVWVALLDQPMDRVRQLAQTLSDDETKRADRFVFDQHRHHFIVGRGFLRAILGHYLQINPKHVTFKYGPQGKPDLETGDQNNLRFNLSHSGSVVLYAITYNRELGVDIEMIKPLEDMNQIAKRFFSPTEYAALSSVSVNRRHEAFFNCWTRKEAYIKAIGDGLSFPLDKFDVSLIPGQPAKLLRVQGDPQAVTHWSLTALDPTPGYLAALIVAGYNWQLSCWRWSSR